MDSEATYKRGLSFAFMVEELMRMARLPTAMACTELVDALDLSTLTRMHELSGTAGAVALNRHSNDMVMAGASVRARLSEDRVAPGGQTDRIASPPRGDGAEPESSGP